jgi:hypothetical protein
MAKAILETAKMRPPAKQVFTDALLLVTIRVAFFEKSRGQRGSKRAACMEGAILL